MPKRHVLLAGWFLFCSYIHAADIQGLLNQLKSDDAATRTKAAQTLAQDPAGAGAAAAALTDLYLADPDENVRRAARAALGLIRTATQKPIVSSPREARPAAAVAPVAAKPPAVPQPTGRLAELIKQVRSTNPADSQKASEELGRMGPSAKPACEALVEVMMRGDPRWSDARIAAVEAMEKIHPELQKAVWKIIVEQMTDVGAMGNSSFGGSGTGPLTIITNLGSDGRGALPLLWFYWRRPDAEGFRVTGHFLQALHSVAPGDKAVTNEIANVLRRKVPVGLEALRLAMELIDQRGLPANDVANLLAPYLADPQNYTGIAQKLVKMSEDQRIKPELVAKALLPLLNADGGPNLRPVEAEGMRAAAAEFLGQLGPAAKDALPALKRHKFEDTNERVRNASANAIKLIEPM